MKRERLISRLGWIVAAILAIQIYFVKEILAAEIVFAIAFVGIVAAFALFYALGAVWRSTLVSAEKAMASIFSVCHIALKWMAQSEDDGFGYPNSTSTH